MTTATVVNPADSLVEAWLDEMEEYGSSEFSDDLAVEWFDSLLEGPVERVTN